MSEPGRPVRVVRRAAGMLLVLLGGLGVILSVAGVVGCWVVRQSLTRTASRVCERSERLLAVTADSLRQVQAGLDEARGDLDALHDGAKVPAPREPEMRRSRQLLLKKLASQFSSRLDGAQRTATAVAETVVVLNALLEQLDEVPLAQTGRLDLDTVRDTSDRLTNLAASARRLNLLLDELPGGEGGAEAAQQASRMKEALSQAATRVEELTDRVDEARARVADLRSRLPVRLTAAAVLLTVLFVWAGVGQLSLLARGWS